MRWHFSIIRRSEITPITLRKSFLALLLTGGHTQLYLVENIGNYKLLGETIDDAVGESFDKVAKLLGLGYPGGPLIEKKALKNPTGTFKLPHPLEFEKSLNLIKSYIKTNKLEKLYDIFIKTKRIRKLIKKEQQD